MAPSETLKAAGEALTGAAHTMYRATKNAIDEGKEVTEKLADKAGALPGSKKVPVAAAIPQLESPGIALPCSPISDDARELSGTGGGNSNSSSSSNPAANTPNEREQQSASSKRFTETFTTLAPARHRSSLLVGEIEEDQPPVQSSTGFLRSTTAQISCIVALAFVASCNSLKTIFTQRTVPLYLATIWTVLGTLFGAVLRPLVANDDADVAATATIGDAEAEAAAEAVTNKGNSSVRISMPEQGSAASTTPKVSASSVTRRMKNAVLDVFRGVSPFSVGSSDCEPVTKSSLSRPVLQPLGSLQDISDSLWTTLQGKAGRAKTRWEEHVHDTSGAELTKRLLAYPDFRTKPCCKESKVTEPAGDESPPSGYGTFNEREDGQGKKETGTAKALGQVDTGDARASILQADIEVDPLFKLRGMDIFRSNNPEGKIWRQPILERNGLRDVPTFLVNLILPGANLVVYFEMPSWVKKFEDIKEEETDPEDTKAFKRFLMGNDEYRNKRWKILPCLIDGPFIIEKMAPPKSNVTIAGRRISGSWHEYSESTDTNTGKTRKALMEVDCDLISNPPVRKICNIVLGQVKKVKIDCAMIVEKPYLAEDEEPTACLGLWRMDHIDMSQTALVPDKDENDLLNEMSVIFGSNEATQIQASLADETARPEVAVKEG